MKGQFTGMWAGMGEPTRDVEAAEGFHQWEAVTTSRPEGAEGEDGTTEAQGK